MPEGKVCLFARICPSTRCLSDQASTQQFRTCGSLPSQYNIILAHCLPAPVQVLATGPQHTINCQVYISQASKPSFDQVIGRAPHQGLVDCTISSVHSGAGNSIEVIGCTTYRACVLTVHTEGVPGSISLRTKTKPINSKSEIWQMGDSSHIAASASSSSPRVRASRHPLTTAH